MTLAWNLARVVAVVAIVTAAVSLLPNAPESLDELVIPDEIWDPLVGVLQLDRYFPIGTLLGIAAASVAIKVGMFALWVYSWIVKHVFGG